MTAPSRGTEVARDRDRHPGGRPFLPLLRAGAVIPFCTFLEAAGVPVERYLAGVRLTPSTLENPDNLVPLRQVLMFLDRAAAREGIENLGLRVGITTEIAELGALGRVVQSSATLSEALARSAEFIKLYDTGEQVWLLEEDDRVQVCHAFTCSDADGARHGDLYTISLLVKAVRLALGDRWWPREIRVPKCERIHRAWYEKTIPSDVVFHDAPFYAFAVDRPLLACALSPGTGRRMSPGADAADLKANAPATDLPGSVCQAVGELLSAGYPDIRWIAELVGLNVRTLQRRLAAAGTSYSDLVERTRFDAAAELLRDDQIKLIDIAFELGYTDPANFTRAFRHWAGMPPAEYRRLCATGFIDKPAAS